jgi:PAS domain S-box-containing protein
MKKNKEKYLSSLRRRAEGLLDQDPKDFQSLPPEEVQKLIHELNVHRIELEMQNEELRRAQIEIEESRNRYSDLYDFAPVGYFALNEKGLIIEANLTGADMLGMERRYLIKRGFSGFITPNFQDIFYHHRKQVFKSRDKQSCQLKLCKKDGTEFYAQLESVATEDDKGNFSRLRTTITDITHLKQAEAALSKSERELKIRNRISEIFLTIPDDEMYTEVLQVILEAMKSKYGYFGYINQNGALVCPSMTRDIWDKCQVIEKDIVFPKDKWGGLWGRSLKEKIFLWSNKPLNPPSGHIPITKAMVVPIIYHNTLIGQITVCNKTTDYNKEDRRLLGSIADNIAPVLNARLQRTQEERKRKRSEEVILESESKFRMLSEQSLLGIAILQDNVFKYANQMMSDIVEYSVEEMLSWKAGEFTKLIYPEDKDFTLEQARKKQKGEKGYLVNYRSRIVSKTGKIKWIEVYSKPTQFKGKTADFVTFIDITERKRMEENLAVSYRFLEIANRHMEITPLLEEMVREIRKLSNCEAVGIRLRDNEGNIPYQAYEGFSQKFYESENHLSLKYNYCMCINVIKGTTDPSLPFFTEGGSFYTNSTTKLLASVPEKDRGSTRNACNKAGYETVALIPIIIGNRILGLIHLADKKKNMIPLELVEILEKAAMQLADAIQRVLAEERLSEAHDKLELRVKERTDELKQTYEQLLHMEKLSAIGKLSASLAHEFGNPIFGIQNVLSCLNTNLPLNEADQELVDLANQECNRMMKLLVNLRDFYRPTTGIMAPTNIHDSIDSMLLLCKKKLATRKIEIEKHYASDLPEILAVEDQIRQIILNLITNAEEAIPTEGGTIKISTELKDNVIVIRVEDSGIGLKPEIKNLVFEPFFTTKPAVTGTGLGL